MTKPKNEESRAWSFRLPDDLRAAIETVHERDAARIKAEHGLGLSLSDTVRRILWIGVRVEAERRRAT